MCGSRQVFIRWLAGCLKAAVATVHTGGRTDGRTEELRSGLRQVNWIVDRCEVSRRRGAVVVRRLQ